MKIVLAIEIMTFFYATEGIGVRSIKWEYHNIIKFFQRLIKNPVISKLVGSEFFTSSVLQISQATYNN